MPFLTLGREQKLKLQGLAVRCKEIPYRFGAEISLSLEPEQIIDIDCSEYTEYLYHKIGYRVPDGAANQFEASKKTISPEIGDLAFKRSKGRISHVGMIISVEGEEVLITEASGTFGKVIIRPLKEFKVYPAGVEYAGVKRLLLGKIKEL